MDKVKPLLLLPHGGQAFTWDSLAASGRKRDRLTHHVGLGP